MQPFRFLLILAFLSSIQNSHLNGQLHFEFTNIGTDSLWHVKPRVATGDFNNNGLDDFVVQYNYEDYMLYEYVDDTIRFYNPIQLNTECYKLEMGDFELQDVNNDGFPEVIVWASDIDAPPGPKRRLVIENLGGTALGKVHEYSTLGRHLLFKDVNKDGLIDMATYFGIHLGTGLDYEFDTLLPFINFDSLVMLYPHLEEDIFNEHLFIIKDYDLDNKEEIITYGNTRGISLNDLDFNSRYLVVEDSTEYWTLFSEDQQIRNLTFLDIDQDTIPEIFLTYDNVFLGLKQGTSDPEVIYEKSGVNNYIIDDFNGDGLHDLYFFSEDDDHDYRNVALTNQSLFSDNYKEEISNHVPSYKVHNLDFDNDNVADLVNVVGSRGLNREQVFAEQNLSNPSKAYNPNDLHLESIHHGHRVIKDFELIDINGDNQLDILIKNEKAEILSYFNSGVYPYFDTLTVLYPESDYTYTGDIDVVDIDLDGFPDIIFRDRDKLYLMYNKTNGKFASPEIIYDNTLWVGTSLNWISGYFIFDIDLDGYQDIVLRQGSSTNWLRNQNGITFDDPILFLDNFSFSDETLLVQDINFDGYLDIVMGQYQGVFLRDTVSLDFIYHNINLELRKLGVGDLDNDNKPDFVYSKVSSSGNVQKLYTFEFDPVSGDYTDPELVGDITYEEDNHSEKDVDKFILKDFDNDGFEDLFYSDIRGSCFIQNLDGQGFYSDPFGVPEVFLPNGANAYASDLNGDGYLDIISYKPFNRDGLAMWINQAASKNKASGIVQLATNGTCNNSSEGLPNIKVISENNSKSQMTFSYKNGYYQLYEDQGNYNLYADVSAYPHVSALPNVITLNFDTARQQQIHNFCLSIDEDYTDLELITYLGRDAIVGRNTELILNVTNYGVLLEDAYVDISYNESLFKIRSNDLPLELFNNKLRLHLSEIPAFQTVSYEIPFRINIPPFANLNDPYSFVSQVHPIENDVSPSNNLATVEGILAASWDPNDIIVLQGDSILEEQKSDYLNYIIRFQNVGTASAAKVIVENEFDQKLNWETLEVIDLSHDATIEYSTDSILVFRFDNIYLPDSISDPEGSNGYISYRIKPIKDVFVGDILNNSADIYFDFNDPVLTNIARTEIVNLVSSVKTETHHTIISPNPFNEKITVDSDLPISQLEIYSISGDKILEARNSNTVNLSQFEAGTYILKIHFKDGKELIRKIFKVN